MADFAQLLRQIQAGKIDAGAAVMHAALAASWGAACQHDRQQFDADIAEKIDSGLSPSGPEVAAAAAAFFKGGPDLLLTLTAPCTAWPLRKLGPTQTGGAPAGPREHAALTPLVNHALHPAISIPCGTNARGLPFVLQVISPRFSDDLLLAAAATLAPLAAGS